ncbi:hypothetical protein [Streptomonospora salina]|uniref:hypothetical protein n=1 Tax=Streptomonospora salina TaxID=104205 RepID=UPI0035EADDAE
MSVSWGQAACAAVSGVLLSVPPLALGHAHPAAAEAPAGPPGTGWIERDPSAADRVGAELTGDGDLRLPVPEAPASAQRTTGPPGTSATFPAYALEESAHAVDVWVDLAGTAEGMVVEARGVRVDGMWTEWRTRRPEITRDEGGEQAEGETEGQALGRIGLPGPVARLQVRLAVSGAQRDGSAGSEQRPDPSAVVSDVRLRPVGADDADAAGGEPEGEGAEGGGSASGASDEDGPDEAPGGGGSGDGAAEEQDDEGGGDGGGADQEPGEDAGSGTSGDADQDEGGDGQDAEHALPERPRPYSARVFATRIGQVGQLTANGHRIGESEHFVALPSRRGLSERGAGDYTVRVCTEPDGGDGGRCAYAPVWDVGPWNITDDYWNPDRQDWTDLPRGLPQAQAAKQDGYNGGLDGFGRRVRNPAGIDLADGTFREGLELPTNAWVDVDYLWTAEYAHRGEISGTAVRETVPVRSGPGTSYPERGLASAGASVDVVCHVQGTEATGPQGRSGMWFRISERDHVPAAHVRGGDGAPACPDADAG